jgi:hypothetical protein
MLANSCRFWPRTNQLAEVRGACARRAPRPRSAAELKSRRRGTMTLSAPQPAVSLAAMIHRAPARAAALRIRMEEIDRRQPSLSSVLPSRQASHAPGRARRCCGSHLQAASMALVERMFGTEEEVSLAPHPRSDLTDGGHEVPRGRFRSAAPGAVVPRRSGGRRIRRRRPDETGVTYTLGNALKPVVADGLGNGQRGVEPRVRVDLGLTALRRRCAPPLHGLPARASETRASGPRLAAVSRR